MPKTAPQPNPQTTRMQTSFLITLLIGLTVGFLALLSGLFQPIFWATLLGVVFTPLQRKLDARFKGRSSSAAAVTLLVIVFVVLVPTLLVGAAVTDQGLSLYEAIQEGRIDPSAWVQRAENEMPRATAFLERFGVEASEVRERLSEAARGASGFVADLALSAGQNLTRFLVMFFIMLYLLFFVLRDGDRILQKIIWALPLGDERERALFAKFEEVGRATLKGTLVVGVVQGSLGGIMFWILGIQGAVFWGAVMIFLSILPAVGSALVWAPAAVVLAVQGSWVKAIVLVIFGVLVIGLVDNILRPLLVGRDTKLPDWLILLSTLGGLSVFGVSGFVIGPIVAAMFLSVWAMFAEEWEQKVEG